MKAQRKANNKAYDNFLEKLSIYRFHMYRKCFYYIPSGVNSFTLAINGDPEDRLIMEFTHRMDTDLLYQSEDFKNSLMERMKFYKLL